jgi:predicted N-formylglutamate amidohydrolase
MLLLGDHAGHIAPGRLGDLGVEANDWKRHIACDIGVAGLGRALAEQLDAVFIHQRYSRLVIDCNRALDDPASIAARSDNTDIPGNVRLEATDRQARIDEIFNPYHQRIARELDTRAAHGRPAVLVSLHSFTPALGGSARPWRFGILHRHDSVLSRAMLQVLAADWDDEVGDNQPYAMDEIDFTVPFHTHGRAMDYLELEVRQDEIGAEEDQQRIASVLGPALLRALSVSLSSAA